jgi:hypothetical protein
MGRGSARPGLAYAIGALVLALSLTACGAEEHENDPRPPIATEVTVSISDEQVNAQPAVVGVTGKDSSQPVSQNEGVENPTLDSSTELNVVFTIANLTDTDSRLEIKGPKDDSSTLIVGNGTARYEVALPTGEYLISAADIPGAAAARFTVGPDRVSSQNDLLLP